MVNQRILDALRMGDPHLAGQTVVHITGLFLKAALAVWASDNGLDICAEGTRIECGGRMVVQKCSPAILENIPDL